METILDSNNSYDQKSEANKLERKNKSQRETGETREYYGTFILYKIKTNPVDYID